jgi:hypothetical protein
LLCRILFPCLLVLLAGCAEFPLFERVDPVDVAVAEALSAARGPGAQQKAALARVEQRFQADPTAANRLGLATMLTALPAPHRDDARAAELLAPLADPAAPGVARFAALLLAQVTERQRLARELERVAKESERSARERAAADKERDKREEALREQLDALRAIERNILEREERLRRKPR